MDFKGGDKDENQFSEPFYPLKSSFNGLTLQYFGNNVFRHQRDRLLIVQKQHADFCSEMSWDFGMGI
jgi:hypothetical protein